MHAVLNILYPDIPDFFRKEHLKDGRWSHNGRRYKYISR